ncbi:MAG TPA: ATP-binding cassette domain-containing protein [Ramlibacter sp.]|nr:ATP-binding cassette domain-containing protein [Ramlibacter sp.]
MKLSLQAVSGRHPAAAAKSASALQRVTLDIAAGEQVAVIGPSGAGKTTLLHLLACALRPSEGTLLVDGSNPWQQRARDLQRLRRELFLAPQVPPLPPRQRVVTAVLAGRLPHQGLWQSLRSLVYPTGIAQADAALARFDLSDKLFARVDRLSGGERQRVGLARALLSQARLLLVDEPLSALDPARSGQAVATLVQAARESGATLVATLHDVPVALQHFPRIVALRGGELAFDLPAAQVTPAMLHDLYGGELPTSPALALEEVPAQPRTVAIHCR